MPKPEVFTLTVAPEAAASIHKELRENNMAITALLEEKGKLKFFITATSDAFHNLSFGKRLQPVEIDWTAQWKDHSPQFHDGYVHLNICEQNIKLEAGPGFGDAGHPTTQLILEMLKPLVKGRTVLDVGCGSGVLSLAAIAAGAAFAHGIDIDDAAIAHAQYNSRLNTMEEKTGFTHVNDLHLKEEDPVILINMISSEQAIALAALKKIKIKPSLWLSSGLRSEEKKSYLKKMDSDWNLHPTAESHLNGWLAFCLRSR